MDCVRCLEHADPTRKKSEIRFFSGALRFIKRPVMNSRFQIRNITGSFYRGTSFHTSMILEKGRSEKTLEKAQKRFGEF